MLEEEESCERRCRRLVAEEDHKQEMDCRQQSRQLWLQEGDANTRFFHLAANGRRRANQILRLKVGDQECIGPQAIGRAIASYFWAFTKRGKQKRWKWRVRGKRNQDQQVELVRPFLEEEVQAAITGLNAEGASSLYSLPVIFYSEFWGLVESKMMATLEEFQHGTG